MPATAVEAVRRLLGASTAALLLATAACSGGDPAGTPAPASTAPASTSPAPTSPAPTSPAPTSPAPGTRSAAPGPDAPLHVALGDSVAAGVGADEGEGWVDLLHARLAGCPPGQGAGCGTRLLPLARLGATTGSVLRRQLPRLEDAAAGGQDVRLVTLDVGGNDVFGPVVGACARGDRASCEQRVVEVLDEVAADYDALLGRVRQVLGADGTLAVMTYYDPVPACALSALAPLSRRVLDGAAGRPGLNDVIARTAREHDALVVDAAGVVGRDDLVGGVDCLHPDGSGHAAIADAFARALDAPG